MSPSAALAFELDLDLPDPIAAPAALPSDWPGPGPIDLALHDLPHASASIEWWYVNAHVETASGRDLSLFAAFFRQARGRNPKTGAVEYAHSVTWALSDPSERRYYPKAAVDGSAPELGLAKLAAGGGFDDERVDRALREVLERGLIPGPTQLFPGVAHVSEERLELAYDCDRFVKNERGEYELELADSRSGAGCRLTFTTCKPATRYGNDGLVHGVADELMFYYFVPRCTVRGSVTCEGKTEDLVEGSGWYDHEFGFTPPRPVGSVASATRPGETSWRWLSLQLDHGVDVSVFMIVRRSTGEVLDNWTIISDADGKRREFRDARLETLATWRSTRSFVEYPTRFRLEVPFARLSCSVDAAFPDQEVLTIISDPGFWEGRVSVNGTLDGRPITGKGWVECKGFRFRDIGAFFEAVGSEVRERVASLLSTRPSEEQARHWLVRGDSQRTDVEPYAEGVEPRQLAAALIDPIREIVDRGGKGWRSYAALACIDVVGGDSRKFLHWLPIPEILHVGSLIVDDVEDASSIRRGGPCCHDLYGTAQAINAGTAAYFLAEPPVLDEALAPEAKLRIYRLYFDAMRAGHAGQALDLQGLDKLALEVVQSGDVTALERRVLATHRLKTAVPAGMLARIGAILGGGSEPQIEALGQFFEAVGLAFQIMDDVLNLRGFQDNLKERGEDVRQGKLTLPIVKGFALLPEVERRSLWQTLHSKPSDACVVEAVIATLERGGALDACEALAHGLVESAWTQLDPLLPESQFKVTFRAFGWYVLDRHY
jgi:geranylgeranyl pyrophosphate synthase/predicted secreted hydrolase